MTVGGLTNIGTIQNYSSEPYISVAAFRAAPTWLDTDDLIPGGTQSKQDNELYNALMRASSWADIYTGGATEQPYLGASNFTQNLRVRTNRWGELSIHPAKSPVQSVTQVYTGWTPTQLTAMPNISQMWIEDNRQIIIPCGYGSSGYVGPGLQFGGGGVSGGVTYVQIEYVAGYFNSTLAAGTYNAASSSLTMNNPAGLIPGTVFRINDPGMEEICTVASGYTLGSATVPLTSPLLYTHTSGSYTEPGDLVGVSALAMGIQQGVIAYAVGLLLREDVSNQAPFAASPFGPQTRRATAEGASGGLINDAEKFLAPFRRVH